VILTGLLLRVSTAFFVTNTGKFTVKERLFISFTWIPKATVQAALCTSFLTEAIKIGAS
jgi:hypothetical protein